MNANGESLEKYRRTLQKKNPNPTRHAQSTFTPNREAQRATQGDTKKGLSGLWGALEGKDDKRCLFLIEQGARWEGTIAEYRQTALHLASGNNLLETCKELIKRGADVNAINAIGNTPLYEAAGFGNAEVCELLLRNGAMASLELKNRDGYTPLLEAMEYSHDAAAKVLLEFGAKPTFTPNREAQLASAQSPVQVAAKREVKVVFKVNVPKGSNNVYIAGTFNCWNPMGNRLERVQQTDVWMLTLKFPEGEVVEYKYTHGTWDSVESTVNHVDRPNRRTVVFVLASDPMQINDTVEEWKGQTCEGSVRNREAEILFLSVLTYQERADVSNLVPIIYRLIINEKQGQQVPDLVDADNMKTPDLLRQLSIWELEQLASSVELSMKGDKLSRLDLSEAAEHYKRAAAINPYNDTALMSYGCILGSQGNLREGIKWVEKAIEINPLNMQAKRNLLAMTRALGNQ